MEPPEENRLDLESPGSRARLENAEKVLGRLRGLVVIDEIQLRPELFPLLPVLADRPGARGTQRVKRTASALRMWRVVASGVVWFGEALPEGAIERAAAAVQRAELPIVAGTSAQLYPAAGLIPLAALGKRRTNLPRHPAATDVPELQVAARRGPCADSGVPVIEINTEATDFSGEVSFALRGKSDEILPRLV